MSGRRAVWCSGLLAVAWLTGCGASLFVAAPDATQSTVALFGEINREDYQAVHSRYSARLLEAVDIEQTRRVFESFREQAGRCASVSLKSFSAISTYEDATVVMSVRVECERTTENVALLWNIEDGEPKLSSFQSNHADSK